MVVTLDQQYNVWEKPTVILFLTFSVLVANPKKLLYTVVKPARGLLNREKILEEKSLAAQTHRYTVHLH